MKVKEMENFQNKRGLKGCKWSSLNAPGTETPLSHPFLKLGELPSEVIGIGLPSMKGEKLQIFQYKMNSMGCKWCCFNATGTKTPIDLPFLELRQAHHIKFLTTSARAFTTESINEIIATIQKQQNVRYQSVIN